MNRFYLTTVALAGLVALSGCAGMGYYGDRYGGGHGDYGDYRRAPDYNGRYGRTSGGEYHRRVERDARHYVDQLDRYLRISNREERAIRDLLIDRTYRLLDRTSYGRHRGVYPFPRSSGRARSWWANTDREIERILDRRYREPYRYYNRYGGDRYTEYYRHRRYDARRGWYDTRRGYDRGYRDGRRADAARDAQRRRADRREDRREDRRDRVEDRRDDRRDRVEDRRDRRADRRDGRADRRDDRRDTRADRRRDQARQEDRRRARTQRDRRERSADRRDRDDRNDRRARRDRDDRNDRDDRRARRDRNDDDRARSRRESRAEDRQRDRRSDRQRDRRRDNDDD